MKTSTGDLQTYTYCHSNDFNNRNVYLRNIENVYWRQLLAINNTGSMLPVAGMKYGDVFIDNDASSNPVIYQYDNNYQWRLIGYGILIDPDAELGFEEDAIFFNTVNNRLVQYNTALIYPREPWLEVKGNTHLILPVIPLNNMNDKDLLLVRYK